jgi:multiple sugar transport system permease protein
MLSPIVLVIGIFRLMAAMGLVDQLWALILTYGAFNLAFAVWMLQSYFATIPKELEEAAWIDGASGFQSLTLVFLPLHCRRSRVTAIFVFINSWNEFVLALTLMRSPDKFTLPLKIFSLVGGATDRLGIRHGRDLPRLCAGRHRLLLAATLPGARPLGRRREVKKDVGK